jgi:adenylate cyclase
MRQMGASARLVASIGGLCLIIAVAATLVDPGNMVRNLREAVFDRLLVWSPRLHTTSRVVVVDIGRDALAAVGPWPWPRDRLADLVNKIADAKPGVLAVNILLSEREPSEPDRADERLAEAIARVPTVLALVLDPAPNPGPSVSATVAITGDVNLPGLLATQGVVLPAPALTAKAKELGVISLPADEGQPVRSVVLLALGADTLLAGFAVETLRAAAGGSTLVASTPPQVLRIGDRSVPLPPDGLMRLHFSNRLDRSARILPAEALLSGSIDPARLAGKIVVLGASAPEAGGLRLTAIDPFMPSVEIEAEAIEQMLVGHIPQRASSMESIEAVAGAVLAVLGILAIILLSPGRAAAVVLGLLFAWAITAIGLSTKALWLTDPATPVIAALFAIQGAGLAQFGITYRQRLAIERRFAFHLPPEMVRRIVENPSEVRFAGEKRIITALFTDIEGFTALTERVGPEAIISLLDRYVDTVAGIIVEHGGMVDKIVGDAVHAFFNAPLDLPDHADRAVACARTIIEATEELRRDRNVAPAQLGRTRIGIETGLAVLGDVGRGTKRDYTAYGHAVNLASRLEAANKRLGSSILLGPGTVAALAGRIPLRCLGKITISGIDEEIEVFEPEI